MMQQEMLHEVGIDSVPNMEPSSMVFADPPDGPLYTGSYGDFGVVQFAWTNGTDEPGAAGLFASSSIPSDANQHSGSNDLFWSNAANDQYILAAESGVGHTDARIRNYLLQQVNFMQQVPSIPLFAIPSLALHSARLQHFQMDVNGILRNVQEWTLSP